MRPLIIHFFFHVGVLNCLLDCSKGIEGIKARKEESRLRWKLKIVKQRKNKRILMSEKVSCCKFQVYEFYFF